MLPVVSLRRKINKMKKLKAKKKVISKTQEAEFTDEDYKKLEELSRRERGSAKRVTQEYINSII